jgi:glycosyltransferase involved in cell wall biosynthesis
MGERSNMKNKNISISIIIPFRYESNREYLLERLKKFEIVNDNRVEYILVDYGTNYKFKDIIKEIVLNKGIKYIYHKTNEEIFAIGKARDIGVEFSCGEFVTFMDIDLVPAT